MAVWLLLLSGCDPGTLVVAYDQPGCEDYDFDDPPAEQILTSSEPLAWHIQHTPVLDSCDAVFTPDLSIDGKALVVREEWEASDLDDDCTVCWAPRVTLKDPSPGSYQIRWYVSDEDVPLDSVAIEVE